MLIGSQASVFGPGGSRRTGACRACCYLEASVAYLGCRCHGPAGFGRGVSFGAGFLESVTTLEAFIRRFGDTYYDDLAKERIATLKQADVAGPPRQQERKRTTRLAPRLRKPSGNGWRCCSRGAPSTAYRGFTASARAAPIPTPFSRSRSTTLSPTDAREEVQSKERFQKRAFLASRIQHRATQSTQCTTQGSYLATPARVASRVSADAVARSPASGHNPNVLQHDNSCVGLLSRTASDIIECV